jgi:hypothetical protein
MQPPSNIVQIYKSQGWNDEAAIKADIAAGGWVSKVPQGSGQTSQPTLPTPSQPVNQPVASGSDLAKVLVEKGGYNPVDAANAANGPRASELAKEFGVSIGGVSGALQGLTAQPTINLPDLYKSIYESSGITDLEKDLSAKEKEYTEARGRVNENPFLSEATRVGKIAKLEQLFNERTANLRSDIARKKADVETQLNLQTKQFDINSQQAQQAISQFNTLLGLGALNNATGEDIANIARSTGLSSSMIEGSIELARKQQTEPQIITYDDGTNQGFVTVDKNTGEIMNKQVIGASTGGGGGTVTEREQTRYQNLLIQDVRNGMTLKDAISLYGDSLNLADITRLYNQYSIYGAAKESGQQIQQIYLTSKKASAQPQEGDISSDETQIYLNGRWQQL